MKLFLLLIAGYFIGCINPAYIISKIRCNHVYANLHHSEAFGKYQEN